MKKFLNYWLAIIAATAVIWLFSLLEKKMWPDYGIVLQYWGYFLAIMIILGVVFKEVSLWEISSGRVEKSLSGPVSEHFLFSSLMLWVGLICSIILIATSVLSIMSGYDNWLGSIWDPLRIISGWPSGFGSLILLISTGISFFLRDNACYIPRETQPDCQSSRT